MNIDILPSISNKTELFQHMQACAVVITPNNRLTLQLLQEYTAYYQQKVLAKPSCYAYQAYLQQSYQQLCQQEPKHAHPLLLTTQQVRYLWQKILLEKNGTVNTGLLNEVMESWRRCALWQASSQHPLFASTAPTRLFQQWQQAFAAELEQLQAIALEQVAPYLIKHNFKAPSTLIWLCFDDFTPEQQALMAYCAEADYKHYVGDFIKPHDNVAVYAAKDDEDEYQQLAHWLLTKLKAGQQRIGVVIPDLQQQAKRIQRLLQQHLPPHSFNLSLGQTLTDYPLVAHALCWLTLNQEQLDYQQACLLLRSPFVNHSRQELLGRAHMLQDSYCLQERLIDYGTFLQELGRYAPLLAACLQQVTAYPASASVASWIDHFHRRLTLLGFPGEYPLNSAAYQCYQRFLLLFDEFRQCALLTPTLSQEQALIRIKELAQTTIFQPKASPAPIHILGLLESAGITFDCLWVTGLTDQCLPQKTRLSAFIPLALQQQLVMPYANPARELNLAQKTLARLTSAAKECRLSYPLFTQDSPNLASPLILDYPSFTQHHTLAIKNSQRITIEESYALPLLPTEQARGGTRLLANQAQCPFRAFAAHRLHAKRGKMLGDGPDDSERGQIIHRIMEIIWHQLKDQTTLLRISATQLDAIIEETLITVLAPYGNMRKHSFTPLIQTVEAKRLKRLVHAALTWERARPPFHVQHLEQTFTMSLAGMDFAVRIDRMDALADKSNWVIDYKSSFPQSTPWKEERPSEPQLLFYALLNDSITTILFAELKHGQYHCKGLSEQDYDMPGIQRAKEASWSDYRASWQKQLSALADEFRQGHCPPQPSKASICQRCEFQSLCRYAITQEE